MIDTFYGLRCDVCRKVMATNGQFLRSPLQPALYTDLPTAVADGNAKLWLVWQEPEDEGTNIWHVLCPNDRND